MSAAKSDRLLLLLLIPLIVLAVLAALLRYLWAVLTNPVRAWGIARAFDRVFNVAANGSELETLSSRAERARREGRAWGCWLCRLLNHIEPDHCDRSRGI